MRPSLTPGARFDGNDLVVLAAIAAVYLGTVAYAVIYDNLLLGALLGALFLAGSTLVAYASAALSLLFGRPLHFLSCPCLSGMQRR